MTDVRARAEAGDVVGLLAEARVAEARALRPLLTDGLARLPIAEGRRAGLAFAREAAAALVDRIRPPADAPDGNALTEAATRLQDGLSGGALRVAVAELVVSWEQTARRAVPSGQTALIQHLPQPLRPLPTAQRDQLERALALVRGLTALRRSLDLPADAVETRLREATRTLARAAGDLAGAAACTDGPEREVLLDLDRDVDRLTSLSLLRAARACGVSRDVLARRWGAPARECALRLAFDLHPAVDLDVRPVPT